MDAWFLGIARTIRLRHLTTFHDDRLLHCLPILAVAARQHQPRLQQARAGTRQVRL